MKQAADHRERALTRESENSDERPALPRPGYRDCRGSQHLSERGLSPLAHGGTNPWLA